MSTPDLAFKSADIDKIWVSDGDTALSIITHTLKTVTSSQTDSQLRCFRTIVLDHLTECKALRCSPDQTAAWLHCLVAVLPARSTSEASDLLSSVVFEPIVAQTLPSAENLVHLVNFLKRTFIAHFELIRYCFENERQHEQFDSSIQIDNPTATGSFVGAVEISTERANAAFKRAFSASRN